MLRLVDIRKRFGATVALDGVSLELRRGEVHGLVGENGAGKSTLMSIIAGGLQSDGGTMELLGREYSPSSPVDARKDGVILIHQELSLCPHLTVAENILLGIEPARWGCLDRKAMAQKAADVLETFHHPDIKPERRVADLPIAARQVVEISRAIAARASIILMDEPTSSLQRSDVDLLFGLIRRMREEQIGVIYISHFLEEVREIADRCTVLRDGGSVATFQLGSVTNDELIAQMVGRPVDNLFPKRVRAQEQDVVLRVKGLSAPPDLTDASFELRRGEILGVAGLMGSGRTGMVRALFGLGRPLSGTIVIGGLEFSARTASSSSCIDRGLGYLSEDRKGEGLALALPVADNVTMTRLSSCSNWGWLNIPRQREQTRRWIERLSVKAQTPSQPARTLSGGNQQKVALARLLHQDVDIMLLDEPTRGIDIGSKAQMYETIVQCADQGKAVLMISSYLPELFGLSDRLAVMSRGRLSAARPTGEWTPESVLQAAIGEGRH